MNNKEKYQKTFAVLHASDDLADKIDAKAVQAKKYKRNNAVAMIAVVIVLAFAGVTGTAYAAISEFREAVMVFFSEKAIEEVPICEEYSVSSVDMASVEMKNVKTDAKATVTFSAYPNSPNDVSRVEIYKNSGFTGIALITKTFHSGNQYTATFSLPAGATYYAKISSATGNSFRGTFVATYH